MTHDRGSGLDPTATPEIAPATMAVPTVPAGTVVPTAPVVPTSPVVPGARVGRRSPGRWIAAGLAALLIVAISAAGLAALVGATAVSTVAKWAPADSIAFVEVRGDLPGDQRQNLGRFLAHFPGFADPSTLDQKLDETLDRIVGPAKDGSAGWSKGVKPWFGGQVGVGLTSIPRMAGLPGADSERGLLIATQTDPAAAVAWMGATSGVKPTPVDYKGVTLQVAPEDGPVVYAATSGVLLVGDAASVRAAIDRNGVDGLADVPAYREAMASLQGEQSVRAYQDLRGYLEAAAGSLGPLASAVPGLDLQKSLDALPPWIAAGLRVESDALVGTTASPRAAGAARLTNTKTVLAAHLPAATVALAEAHDVGSRMAAAVTAARTQAAASDALKRLEAAAKVLGGLDGLTGWIDDAGVAAVPDGTVPAAGIVIVPTDGPKAAATLASVKNLLALAGGSSGVTSREAPYAGGTITTFDVGDARKLLGAGASELPVPAGARLEVSVGVADGIVAIGLGDRFVKAVLDTKPGSSLADQPAYRAAMDRVGAENTASAYADLTALRGIAEARMASSADAARYQKEYRPYLEPFTTFAASMVSGDVDRSTSVLVVSQPTP